MDRNEQHRDYDRIEEALSYLQTHRGEQPGLEEAALHVGLSPHHFQRVFSRWVGVSPKRFLQFLTVEHARACLAESRSVLETSFEVGLSSPGRLHDLTVAVDAVTPGEIGSGGEGLTIRHAVVSSPFGDCFIGATERGVCWLAFPDRSDAESSLHELEEAFPAADHEEESAVIGEWRDRIFDRAEAAGTAPLPVLLSGTNFQLKVWEALIRVPAGHLCTYGDLAGFMGRPTATRAVASAVAANHVAVLIPCHRVIRSMGAFGQYRWGAVRKQALIGWEQVRHASVSG